MGPGFESLKVHQKFPFDKMHNRNSGEQTNLEGIKTVSVINVEGPPVPIPNTEVKLNCAEDT